MNDGHTVVVVGGTGRLGQQITRILLSEFRSSFPVVRVLTRDPACAKSQDLAAQGAELHKFDGQNLEQSLIEAFEGADVIVNVLPSAQTPKEVKRRVQAIAIRSDTKVYFLSEFGVDHRLNDFPGYDHHEWEVKRELASDARSLAAEGKTKVIAVFNGIFLEGAFRPFAGYDIEQNRFSCLRPPGQRITFTSTADIGRAVARLALLALDPATASDVPDEVRIAGNVASYEDVRDLVATIKGMEKGYIKSEDLAELKGKLEKGESSVLDYIRVLMGEGKLDFSGDNLDELVNPAQSVWKWKTVEEQLRSQIG